jgi:hypothetical protein
LLAILHPHIIFVRITFLIIDFPIIVFLIIAQVYTLLPNHTSLGKTAPGMIAKSYWTFNQITSWCNYNITCKVGQTTSDGLAANITVTSKAFLADVLLHKLSLYGAMWRVFLLKVSFNIILLQTFPCASKEKMKVTVVHLAFWAPMLSSVFMQMTTIFAFDVEIIGNLLYGHVPGKGHIHLSALGAVC